MLTIFLFLTRLVLGNSLYSSKLEQSVNKVLFLLIDANIVYLHGVLLPAASLLRSDIRSGPEEVTTNSNIENPMERLVERLAIVSVRILALARPHGLVDVLGVILLIVQQPANLVLAPFHSESMETIGEIMWELFLSRAMVDIVWPRASIVDGAHDLVWFIAPQLHDVDLAGGSPCTILAALGHHPDGWPQIVARRQTGTGLVLAVSPGVAAQHARRGEVMTFTFLNAHIDHKVAILETSILGTIGRVTL